MAWRACAGRRRALQSGVRAARVNDRPRKPGFWFVAKAATKPRLPLPAEGGHANDTGLAEGDPRTTQDEDLRITGQAVTLADRQLTGSQTITRERRQYAVTHAEPSRPSPCSHSRRSPARDRQRSGSNQLCLAERERLRNVGVDATTGERLILLVEVNRGVDFEDNVSAAGVWQEIDSDEIRANRASGIDREWCGGLRWRCRDPPAAEGHIVAPLARRRLSPSSSDHPAACHDHAQVVSQRRHEVLDEHAVTAKPATLPNRREAPFDLTGVTAPHDVLSPTTELRLEHEWRLERPHLIEARCVKRAGLRNPGPGEPQRCLPLVVGNEQRRGSIQNSHATTFERGELVEAGLHAVKRRRHVQPHQRDVTASQPPASIRRAQ